MFRHIPLDVFAPPGESSSTAAAFYYDSRVITWSTWQTFLPLFVIPLSIVIRPSSFSSSSLPPPLIKTQFLIRPRGGHGGAVNRRRKNLPCPFIGFCFYHFHEWGRGGGEGGGGWDPAAGRYISGRYGGARFIPNTGFLAGITDIHG